jgi:hypothetical protein
MCARNKWQRVVVRCFFGLLLRWATPHDLMPLLHPVVSEPSSSIRVD